METENQQAVVNAEIISMSSWFEKLNISELTGFKIDNLRFNMATHVFEAHQPVWWKILMFNGDPLKAVLIDSDAKYHDQVSLNVPYADCANTPMFLGTLCTSMMLWGNIAIFVTDEKEMRKIQQLYFFTRDMIYAERDEVSDDVKPCIDWRNEFMPMTEELVRVAFKILD